MTYEVVLIDREGYETTDDQSDTLKDAKAQAKYLLSDKFARACESTHTDMRTKKVEVRKNGECVWDAFI